MYRRRLAKPDLYTDFTDEMESALRGSPLMYVLVALLAAVIIWASVSSVDVVATAHGSVVSVVRQNIVQTTQTSRVKSFHVKRGQDVSAGDLLVEFDAEDSLADETSSSRQLALARLELARLKAELYGGTADYGDAAPDPQEIAAQERLRASREDMRHAKVAEGLSDLEARQAALQMAIGNAAALDAVYQIAKAKEEKIRPYIGQVVSSNQYTEMQQAVAKAMADVLANKQTVIMERHNVKAAKERLRLIREGNKSELMVAVQQAELKITTLESSAKKAGVAVNGRSLYSPIAGKVQDVALTTIGQVVTPAEVLVKIIPSASTLIIEAQLASDQIGFVEIGQPAEIKVHTFPFHKYGTIHGTVSWVSPDADVQGSQLAVNGRNSQPLAAQHDVAPKYRILIVPKADQSTSKSSTIRIGLGMTVSADVVVGERRIIEIFTAPVVRYWDETVKLR